MSFEDKLEGLIEKYSNLQKKLLELLKIPCEYEESNNYWC